jgi:hypothetical protein
MSQKTTVREPQTVHSNTAPPSRVSGAQYAMSLLPVRPLPQQGKE